MPKWLQISLLILLIIEFLYTLPIAYPLYLLFGTFVLLGYLLDLWEKRQDKYVENHKPAPPPNPNPYTLEELQNHLDAYRQKAIRSGGSDKWKYGRDYERYVGYLLEKQGYKVIYNGAIEGSFDGGIDLICHKNNEVCLIQCKRWKNSVGAEYIRRFNDAVEEFKIYHSEYRQVKPLFYSTNGYTAEAHTVAKRYGIKCCYEKFDSILEYPPVKCINSHGVKIYFLPFDKNFDKVPDKFDILMCYKFTVADAERAGYHYNLNQDVLLKEIRPITDFHYWNGDKNFPVGWFHAGFVEFIDLKSCRIHSLIGGCLTFSARYIKISPFQKGYTEDVRIFRYGRGLPQVYENNRWVILPKYRTFPINGDPLSYTHNQKMYEYTMFKIVHWKIFGEEYPDNCEFGWHYEKGYPEYR